MLYGSKYLMRNGQRLSSGSRVFQLLTCDIASGAFEEPCGPLPSVRGVEDLPLHLDLPGYASLTEFRGECRVAYQPLPPSGSAPIREPAHNRDALFRHSQIRGLDCCFFSFRRNDFSGPSNLLPSLCLHPLLQPLPVPLANLPCPLRFPTVNFPSQLFLRPHVPRIQSLPNLDNPLTVFFCCLALSSSPFWRLSLTV